MWLSAISAIKIINQDDSLRKERQLIEFMKNNSNHFKRITGITLEDWTATK